MPDINFNLEEATRVASQDQFWAVRGHAVQSYASLEQSLCHLFATLAGTTDEVAGIIFFRTGAAVRNAIVDKLFQRKFHDSYNLFRNSLIKELRPIDAERNLSCRCSELFCSSADGIDVPAQKSGCPASRIFRHDWELR